MSAPKICRYCGGVIRRVSGQKIYGDAAANRLKLREEWFYQCQNCNARVGCHKGTKRPLGNVSNEVLRLKRKETHQVFDAFWKAMSLLKQATGLLRRFSITERWTASFLNSGFPTSFCLLWNKEP